MFGRSRNKEFKRWHLVVLLVVIVVAVGYRLYSSIWPKATVTIAHQTMRVLVANTQPRVIEGWSNKKDMGSYGGMLFVFPTEAQHIMVMRDMHFPLDIVWFKGLTVVDIASNLPPEAGRSESELTQYRARASSTMVLELPAGFANQYGLKVGDTIKIDDYPVN